MSYLGKRSGKKKTKEQLSDMGKKGAAKRWGKLSTGKVLTDN